MATPQPSRPLPAPLDLSFQPGTYWPDDACRTALLGNIKGTVRRRLLQESIEAGAGDIPPEALLQPALGEDLRRDLGRIHPSLMGGEYLPDYLETEVEIARIVLESVTGDVISIRARIGGEGIAYRIVDEYELDYTCAIPTSLRPLTQGEMIRLLEASDHPAGPGLVVQLLEGTGYYTFESCLSFVTVESDFYPGLRAHFKEVCRIHLEGYFHREED